MKCVLRAELCYSVSVFHWAAEPKTQVWLWLQQVSDQTPACRVLHSPGTLRRCPVPTWGRIPISKISWYLRSRRSFSGGRLLPACSRRSGPSPGASSPASSLTFFCYPHSTARNRNTREQDDRMKTLAGNSPPSRAWRLHARGALLLLSGFLFFLEFCIFFYMWQATKHASKLSAGLRRLRPRLNIASPSTSRNMWTRARGPLSHRMSCRVCMCLEQQVKRSGLPSLLLLLLPSLLTPAAPDCHAPSRTMTRSLSVRCLPPLLSTPLHLLLLLAALEALCSSFASLLSFPLKKKK